MPLRIELKPFERLIINGAAIRNGDRRSSFLVETRCKFLRESEIITQSEADTPAKQIHLTLTVVYLADDPRAAENLFFAQAAELLTTMPDAASYLVAIRDAVEAREYHRAIKRGKELVAYEAARREAAAAQAPT